jgi:hypothetical protein
MRIVVDVNGDGRLDIISQPCCWDTPRLDIWLNRGSPPGATGFGVEFEPVVQSKKTQSP